MAIFCKAVCKHGNGLFMLRGLKKFTQLSRKKSSKTQ